MIVTGRGRTHDAPVRSDLSTEGNVDSEMTLSWSSDRADLGITRFHNHIRDVVSVVLVQGETVAGRPVRECTTLGSATLKGVSGTVRRSFEGRPMRWVEVAVRGAAAQRRVSGTAGETQTPGYAVTNLRWASDVGGVAVTAGVENLFDGTYRFHLDPLSLFRPGRNLFLRVSRSF
jgi:outer membrane receptor for ferrienterochelin and colicin